MTSTELIPKANPFLNPGPPTNQPSQPTQLKMHSSNIAPRRDIASYWKSSPPTVRPSREPHVEIGIRFGNRIRELRQRRDLTQVKTAKQFGVDRSYISDLERGRKSISIHTMEIFALGFSMTLSELLDGI